MRKGEIKLERVYPRASSDPSSYIKSETAARYLTTKISKPKSVFCDAVLWRLDQHVARSKSRQDAFNGQHAGNAAIERPSSPELAICCKAGENVAERTRQADPQLSEFALTF